LEICFSRLPHREVETRGHAISILFGFWTSFICDTYVALAWNNRIKCGPGASSSSDYSHPRIQQNRRQEAGDIQTLGPLDVAISIEPRFCSYFDMRIF
uniref:Small integral membrane protein 2 n=1 Tax=Sus scrofa TaxID=9823 RepID=A0A8D1CAL3_PIG